MVCEFFVNPPSPLLPLNRIEEDPYILSPFQQIKIDKILDDINENIKDNYIHPFGC